MDYKCDFEDNWRPVTPESLPPTGEKCIVSDGHIVVLATFTKNDEHAIWLFHGLTECANENFKVRDWMYCPRPKLRNENEIDLEKNS